MSAKKELYNIINSIQIHITDNQLNELVDNIFDFHKKFVDSLIKGTSKDKKESVGIINYFKKKG